MRTAHPATRWGFLVAIVIAVGLPEQLGAQMYGPIEIQTTQIDTTVTEFPPDDNFSRPERAYATIHRHLAAGDLNWRQVSVSRLGSKLPGAPERPRIPSDRAIEGWLHTQVVEVLTVSENIAFVIGQWPVSKSYDVRCFELEGGRWLSLSNDQADTLEHAQRIVENAAANRRSGATWKKRVTYPADYIKSFDRFLATSAREPREMLLQTLSNHRLVIIGEIHHRPEYWKLNAELVADPAFARSVGTIYLELPGNDQALIDGFLAAGQLDTAPVIETLRDMLWMGWPDQAMLDFFIAVRNANQALPEQQRIRIVLVDMPLRWKELQTPKDLTNNTADRDELMAGNIIKDIESHAADTRHGLFIVGYIHAAEKLKTAQSNEPLKTAAWRLAQALGPQCFSFVQHSPQISNSGRVYGRAARGLFDTAFANNGFRPVAFALDESPFGGEPFDLPADLDCSGSFQDAFDGYIFLEKLEDEWFSPLIDGFYTDEFTQESSRRLKLTENKSLDEMIGVEGADAESLKRWMGQTWGSPRQWRDKLGTIDAWRLGDDLQMMND